ncbi:BZ3500_MvSof-1268-A1-R1_Chr1-3g02480 [Microbotryum saponariae]|uniref:BZ3500_MvSof-1268-A1-R1_Chr1-3g02480 protein n=1 Tax=Microbotryum saponariae TaxID=289078 RepID=A0A2X0MPV8_9BASI|nr:BZ3500_MvSof-1268-A1-R1_Chr1-3g02480 [Microbotryum saponariae]SCZ96350.1 BZ3501_MvSof-1269-A2-R1_Chr1-3g02083 [Microbotryum saponariae]
MKITFLVLFAGFISAVVAMSGGEVQCIHQCNTKGNWPS